MALKSNKQQTTSHLFGSEEAKMEKIQRGVKKGSN